jgi:beta-lactamase superfamily II metal-dependent hydrolase
LKLIYGKTIFIFAGDAQTESEKEILQKGYNIKCDVLKVGHHGSDTSSTDGFIKNAAPEYAVISVGKDNNYGLPDDSIIKRLEKYNCTVLRTDKLGTISFISNGNTVSQVED